MGVYQNWIPVRLSMSGTATATVEGVCGVAGTVRLVVAGTVVKPTEGAVAVNKGSTSLLTTDLLLHSLTNATAAEQTLAAGNKTLEVAATDVLQAVYTITTAGSYVGCGLTVWIEPTEW